MNDETLAKNIHAEMEKDLALPSGTLKVPVPPSKVATVTKDIEALKHKLDMIARGIQLLKDQL